MATLSLQVRLGITKGWRVRTLNEFKFYNQAVAHCLFIFTALRMRGYRERMWTLHYTVFMSGKKYVIYIEYFLLPYTPRGWRRGPIPVVCLGFSPRRQVGVSKRLCVVKFAPIDHISKVVRRVAKRTSIVSAEGTVWLWAHRAMMAKAVLGLAQLPNATPRTAAGDARLNFYRWVVTNRKTDLTGVIWSTKRPARGRQLSGKFSRMSRYKRLLYRQERRRRTLKRTLLLRSGKRIRPDAVSRYLKRKSRLFNGVRKSI